MKKLIAALAACLLLCACSGEQTVPETPPVQEQPVQEQPAVPSQPTVSVATEEKEGLVEDTVGYIYQYPVFAIDGIDEYYKELILSLEDYARQSVYSEAADRHTIANVTGTYDAVPGDNTVTVTYFVSVEFGDGDTQSFDRTDVFDLTTGQRQENQ